VLSEPMELKQGFNETSRLVAEQIFDSFMPSNASIDSMNGKDDGNRLDEATARNVANIMAKLLREIIESSRRENTPLPSSPSPPLPPPTPTSTLTSFLTTGLDDVISETTTTKAMSEQTEVRVSEELPEILITDVDGALLLLR
ncbi:hypothetical protein PMAYCL1PPCAC_09841, partial [Pristionchus mayeri]